MTIDELSARLERVEKQNRRMHAVGMAVVVLSVAIAALGQAAPPPKATDNPVIRTRLVEIVDEKGVVRANLGMTPGGDEAGHLRPALTLFNEKGIQEQVSLGVTWTGMPLLKMSNGTLNSALTISGSGAQRGLIVRGKDESSVHVGTGVDARPVITVMTADGKVEFSAPR